MMYIKPSKTRISTYKGMQKKKKKKEKKPGCPCNWPTYYLFRIPYNQYRRPLIRVSVQDDYRLPTIHFMQCTLTKQHIGNMLNED